MHLLAGLLVLAAMLNAFADELPAPQFQVSYNYRTVPVYHARICNLSPEERRTLGEIQLNQTTETSFASFDLDRTAVVYVDCRDVIKTAKILPTAAGIVPEISGPHVIFKITKPGQYTLEINGDWLHALHLFVDPVEKNVPDPKDPNVIYFGPGEHEIETLDVPSGKTVYLARGAIVYGKSTTPNPTGPILSLVGKNITVRGRGILDGSRCRWHTRSAIDASGSNITVEGIVIRDSSGWTLPVHQADHVTIDNVKIFGWRGNSDGIDLCNCRDVEVSNCFLRTLDDLVVLKTNAGQGESRDITVRHCVLWNEFAHALSLGAELREPLTHIRFTDCDVIHDKGREWLLRAYNCDSALSKDVVFDHIRIEEARRLMSLWIGKAVWSVQPDRGHIENITFQNIASPAPELPEPLSDLVGFDAEHLVSNVKFQDVVVGGKPLKVSDVRQNKFVRDVTVTP